MQKQVSCRLQRELRKKEECVHLGPVGESEGVWWSRGLVLCYQGSGRLRRSE